LTNFLIIDGFKGKRYITNGLFSGATPAVETPTIIEAVLAPTRLRIHKPHGLLDSPELLQLLKEWLLLD
jgi:hypothetical protein